MPIEESATLLLGLDLVTAHCRARIVETEAYWDERDPGSHSWRGPTPRIAPMYGPPGHCYIYFTYGNHWLLNVTARPEGEAAAVLIRAAMPLHGLSLMQERRPKAKSHRDLLSGPGKLTQALALGPEILGIDLLGADQRLHIQQGEPPGKVLVSPRVGLSPHRGAETPWRFIDAANVAYASKPWPKADSAASPSGISTNASLP
ncbi:MAG: DNA-3-methyladenine glycosylase [Armatimonadetes bacterium]|nr:DNA-3-methyladenine glycosylase [Armatimonadota bacterium]